MLVQRFALGKLILLVVLVCSAAAFGQSLKRMSVQVAEEMWLEANESRAVHLLPDLDTAEELLAELDAKVSRLNALYQAEIEHLISLYPELTNDCREALRDIRLGGSGWWAVEYECE